MTGEEKIIVDAVVSMSKSMSKLAYEVGEIKNLLIADGKMKLKESKLSTKKKNPILVEHNRSDEIVKIDGNRSSERFSPSSTPIEEIRKIRNSNLKDYGLR